MSAYYNENDPKAAAWLRELIREGLIADGEVDERSIVDVRADDIRGFEQCHFFAGIGGWSYALRLAGWPDDRHVWTGSCPCQPFSSAGRGDGENDPRDLWPAWFQLIELGRPHVVFGEQVADAARNGWLDRLCADMEASDYAIGACVLGAHSAGAPHVRLRLYFVADSSGDRLEEQRVPEEGREVVGDASRSSGVRQDAGMAYAYSQSEIGSAITWQERSPWRIEPAVGRVAHGVPHKLVEPALRGFGNAIVPQVAAEVIAAYMEIARGVRP